MNRYLGFLLTFLTISNNLEFLNSESIELLKIESDIINVLEKYINDYEQQIDKLKSNLEELQKEHEEANQDITRYLSNPINAYLLTKRLTTDWKHVETIISSDQNLEFFKNITSNFGAEKLPSEEDLRNEILRLDRLRKTYNLPIGEVVNGYLDGVKYSDPLKAVDSFEIGRQLYYAEQYESADEWLALAIKMFDYKTFPNAEDADLAKASILDYYSMTQFNLGNYQVALNLAAESIILYPEFEHIKDNIRKIRRKMAEDKTIKTTAGIKTAKKSVKRNDYEVKYESGCRNDLVKPNADLYCENYFGKSAFLKLAPLKLEILNLKPKLVMVHDFLFEREIEKFLNMSEGKMSTATLLEQYKGIDVSFPTLNSQYFVVSSDQATPIHNLNQRINDLSGLNAKSDDDESLQISSYDVGNHFVSKTDHIFKVSEKAVTNTEGLGNRMASTIIFLNDVEKGGATVFPDLNTVVFPEKGAALFFYNTLPNGKPDQSIQYAGCPVLKGVQYILTKWIREKDQVLTKPCNSNENDRFEL